MKVHNTIIYLIGIPAVGKYTVAREIARMTGAKVVDNQLINTPVFTVVGYDGTSTFPFPPAAWGQIEKIQRAVLSSAIAAHRRRALRNDCHRSKDISD